MTITDNARHFSGTYAEARQKFMDAAAGRGAAIESFEHPSQRGALGETLAIDVAYLGQPRPDKLLILSSGTHGPEGFCGSGCQVAAITSISTRCCRRTPTMRRSSPSCCRQAGHRRLPTKRRWLPMSRSTARAAIALRSEQASLGFGTLPADEVLTRLRADTWLRGHPEAPPAQQREIRRNLRDAFYCDNDGWKGMVLGQARVAMLQAVQGLAAARVATV